MNFAESLSRYILDNTTEQVFWRGVEYAKSGKVQRVQEDARRLHAIVKGSQPYEVEFRQGPKYVKGYCICPYALNEDYCKHVVALAVCWDLKRDRELPQEEEVKRVCVEVEYGFEKKVEQMFRDPLHADLEFLARASDSGSWVRPHTHIPLVSPIGESESPIGTKETLAGLQKIAKFKYRSRYDSYFCAGEISALLSVAYDVISKRLARVDTQDYLAVFSACVEFYYNTYLQMIDGSDGVWQIPFARLQHMFGEMQGRGVSKLAQEELRLSLNEKITGWGDIFEELYMQFA